MKLEILTPTLALNKAYLKMSLNQGQIDSFKQNLRTLFERINDQETEEHLKNIVADFLKDNYFRGNHEINTKGRQDLAIHTDKTSSSSVGVIIEVKRPNSKTEMISRNNLNAKALQELVLYYLRERITSKNIEVKNLIVTNIYEWFIFDSTIFDKLFAQNKSLVAKFTEFEAKSLAITNTDSFYNDIAKPFIEEVQRQLEFTYFNLKDYKDYVSVDNSDNDEKLIDLFKILSPEHLLKKPFANDSNSLNKEFYNELLYILGLAETKDKSKKLIQRAEAKNRHDGSLIENTINKLESNFDELHIQNIESFGASREEQIFSIALELCITWLNRILFLKLLEGQLKTYHPHDKKSYSFLNSKTIEEFDDLEELFFEVLAKKTNERSKSVNDKFKNIPYLNSSLFDPNEIEKQTIHISALKDRLTLPLYNQTVLKDNSIRSFGDRKTLHYLLDFLDAYDFASDGRAKIQTTQKGIINAAVLGLIFEKINGYKDGSFFTPGYITMYMCRETIRRTVVQKFNEALGINCEKFEELSAFINPEIPINRQKANEIVNSIKICDPAVGSGHFLVSALNEMIAVKSDLGILSYKNGNLIRSYKIEIVNDELIILNTETEELFEYRLNQRNNSINYLQDLQETLFHEKQTIIEQCLFGVDINPKSVMICRLRLWIELLKNAYYKNENELETLPNIDINIKSGNSLVSKFGLNTVFKQSDLKVFEEYKTAVAAYKEVTGRQDKNNLKKLIAECKNKFTGWLESESKTEKEIKTLETQIATKLSENDIFENEKSKQAKEKELQKLSTKLAELKDKAIEEGQSKIYDRAFEWRFEFPEVLNEEGEYLGFDIVIGNPPYVDFRELDSITKNGIEHYNTNFNSNRPNLYQYFIELCYIVGREKAQVCLINPNQFLSIDAGYGLRKFLIENTIIQTINDFSYIKVFDNASTYTIVWSFRKEKNGNYPVAISKINDIEDIGIPTLTVRKNDIIANGKYLIIANVNQILINKIENNKIKLNELSEMVWGTSQSGYGKLKVLSSDYSVLDRKIQKQYMPILQTRDIKKYHISWKGEYIPKNIFSENVVRKFELDEKILIARMTLQLQAAKELNKSYVGKSTILTLTNKNYNYNYILAILNSKVIDFWYKNYFENTHLSGGYIRFDIPYLKKIPIPTYTNKGVKKIENLVDKILEAKKKDPKANTGKLEQEIDQLVYKLYDLTEEEIAIVEGAK